MKKLYVILVSVLFALTSSLSMAAGGHHGGGSAHQGSEGVKPSPYETPRGFGDGSSYYEADALNRLFNEMAPGAWSNDHEDGKDKPSSDN